MTFEIIDFHTHPFRHQEDNICSHKEFLDMTEDNIVDYLKELGISKICGTVLCRDIPGVVHYENVWEMIAESNRQALALHEKYGDFYVPGIHVHPKYVQQSCDEIEKMHKLGFRLIGELVPYMHEWEDYSQKAFDEILDVATQYEMIVNFHSLDDPKDNDRLDEMVRKHPNTLFVAAHPGEYHDYLRQLNRMRMSENYYLDLSGTGLFRHGMLRRGIDEFGPERFLFGSDFPVCSPAVNIGGIGLDTLLSDEEKTLIFAGNAKRLLGLA